MTSSLPAFCLLILLKKKCYVALVLFISRSQMKSKCDETISANFFLSDIICDLLLNSLMATWNLFFLIFFFFTFLHSMEGNMFTMWAGITKIQGELLPAVQMEHGKSLHNNWPDSILYANKYVIFWSNW